jgi:hypothetical protein
MNLELYKYEKFVSVFFVYLGVEITRLVFIYSDWSDFIIGILTIISMIVLAIMADRKIVV